MNKLERQCLRIRIIEEKISSIYPSDKIQSPVHLSNGQEAVSVGVCAALERQDLVFGTYRGHALYLAKGGSLKRMMAELYGRDSGCGRGKAGSMHLADRESGVMGCSAIVSSTISHAVGAAYAAKFRKTGQLVACFFGEGATGAGVYHESLNFAGKHKLPILFVCENNDKAIFTRVSDIHSFDIGLNVESYAIDFTSIEDGWKVSEVNRVATNLTQRLRQGIGPQFMEVKTFRYMEHVGPNNDARDDSRTKEAFDAWYGKDPLSQHQVDSDLHRAVEKELAEALEFADRSPFPSADQLLVDVL